MVVEDISVLQARVNTGFGNPESARKKDRDEILPGIREILNFVALLL